MSQQAMDAEQSELHVERFTLDEKPTTWRYLCDDGQIVEYVGHSEQACRLRALAYFEANTLRAKPAKASAIWVKIEGRAAVA